LENQIEECAKCLFNRSTHVRYCGGSGTDHRVMFVAESPSTSGGTGVFKPSHNFRSTGADRLFYEARQKVGL
jgi:uracil-DNA glycosylase family 4